MTMFHISARSNRDSILSQGLRPGAKDPARLQGSSPFIWLVADLGMARVMATKSWGGSRGQNDIWMVNTSGLPLEPDPHEGHLGITCKRGGDDEHEGPCISWVTRSTISPSRLSLTEGLGQQFVDRLIEASA